MTVRGTLALVAVFAVLAVYVVVVDRPEAPSTTLPPPLLAVPVTEVTRLEVAWPSTRVEASRSDGGWRDADGRVLPSDVVDDVLSALATVRPLSTLQLDPGEDGEYGFGPDRTSVTVSADDGPRLGLDVGARNPAWTGLYVRRQGGGEVLLVGSLLHWELEKLRAAASR